MNKHNKEILEAIRSLKMELKIEALVNRELGLGQGNTEGICRLSNLYSFIDIEDLLTSDSEARKLLSEAQESTELNELMKEMRK